jgi:hypothetical protein
MLQEGHKDHQGQQPPEPLQCPSKKT